jgi:protein-disulfide isomerase
MRALIGSVLASLVVTAAAEAREVSAKTTPGQPVALVGGVAITEAELGEAIEVPLRELRQREFQLRSQALDELIASRLIAQAAAAQGVPEAALVKAEVEDKAPLADAEVKGVYEANKSRFGTLSEAEALKQVQARLLPQRQRERRAAWVRELRQKAAVKVLIEPLRVNVDIAGRPVRGNKEAPVTIVEFSDFQCPYCSRARPTVNKVREVYGDKVRMIFRNFPLQMHAEAPKAGEAAVCAGEQGKFWEMHDRLFADQSKLQVNELKAHAIALGLDPALFNPCLDSGKHASDVQKDTEEGASYGVSGTPAFFINGRPLVGAQPFENFAQVIDDELERAGAGKPAAGPGRP